MKYYFYNKIKILRNQKVKGNNQLLIYNLTLLFDNIQDFIST